MGRLNVGGWKLRCPLELYQCYLGYRLDLAKAEAPNISLRGSYLRSRLSARLLHVVHTLNLADFRCDGGVVLRDARINGLLNCAGAIFINPNGQALNAERLTANTDMSLSEARCTGETSLVFAHIGGALNCYEAIFANPSGHALNAVALTADAGMSLKKAQCTGETSLTGAHIGGALGCREAVFSNPNGQVAVQLAGACVTMGVGMRPAALDGDLDLRGANVGTWVDEKKTWPKRVLLEGFVYGSIKAPDATVKDRLRSWLPQISYLPQPYEQLAGVYRREGDDGGARAVAIGKQRARRANVQGWSRWPSRVWSTLLRWTIGYGYRPVLALIPWFVLLGVGSLLFQLASRDRDLLHPAKTGSEQPGFNTFRYTVDLLLPVANFKQRDLFVTGGWAAWASFGFIFAGWLLAAIVVAGLTGVFKRD